MTNCEFDWFEVHDTIQMGSKNDVSINSLPCFSEIRSHEGNWEGRDFNSHNSPVKYFGHSLKGILHIKVCLKVLGSTTAYMRKK